MKSHILFVDDEAPIRELLSLYFRKKGLEVTMATTTQEAKDCAARGGFHLAIVDLNLAGENGMELLADFKTRLPQMPVIIFTGLAGEDLMEQARRRGADGFMRKTESLGTLYEEVCRHLPPP